MAPSSRVLITWSENQKDNSKNDNSKKIKKKLSKKISKKDNNKKKPMLSDAAVRIASTRGTKIVWGIQEAGNYFVLSLSSCTAIGPLKIDFVCNLWRLKILKTIETETLKQRYRIHAYRALASPSLIALSSKVFSSCCIEPLKTSLGILESLSAMRCS